MEHKGTKIIETERLILRPFRAEDAEPMFRNWTSDPEVSKFLTWPTHESVEVSKWVVDSWCEKNNDPKYYNWAIELKNIHEPIGSISAVKVYYETQSATVGYCIGRSYWGQEITAEALRAIIKFFFEEVGMNRVSAYHDSRNPNSGKVMKKCGMTYEGTWRAGGVNNQGICDKVWYSVLREEYEKCASNLRSQFGKFETSGHSIKSSYSMYIETKRMSVRDFCLEDVYDLHEILGDAVTMENCEPAYDFGKTRCFLSEFCIGKRGAFAAVHKDSKKVIGYILFKPWEDGIFEMGWIFNKNFWRQGYSYESCSEMIRYAFSTLDVHKIIAETIDNEKSTRLMEKLGMTLEGVQKSQTKDNSGSWRDVYLYGILRESQMSEVS